MTWQQALVVAWIQFAVATAVLLWGTLAVIKRLRQPAERARLVLLAVAAALAMPILSALAPWPVWNLGWIAPASAPLADTSAAIGPPPVSASDTKTHTARIPTASTRSLAPPNEVQPAAEVEREPPSAVVIRTPWSLIALVIIFAHATAAFLFAVQWIVGRWQLARLCRAAAIPAQDVCSLWNGIARSGGRRTRLLISDAIHSPLVFGLLRPTVVFPARLASGNESSLRYCVAHEWSHIARGDLRAWSLVRACRFLFWYQPAYWMLARELRICQEFLADQGSAPAGEDRIEYSEMLLDLARRRSAVPATGAINMLDHPSQLGRRVRMLLDGTTFAARCRRRVAWSALALLVASVSVFSVIRLDAVLAEETPVAKEDKTYPSLAAKKRARERNMAPGAPIAALHYTCEVVEKNTGKPIAGAAVVVRRSESSTSDASRIIEESKHTTDAQGKFSVTIPPEQAGNDRLYIELDVEHPHYAAKKGFGYALSMIVENETLGSRPFFEKTELWPAEPVTGTVLSPDGKPLAGVKIQGFAHTDPRSLNDHSFVDTVTGADGKFRMPLLKGGDAAFWVIPKDYAIVQRYLGKVRGDLGEFKLEPGIRASGRLLDAGGKPLADVALEIYRERSPDDDVFNQLQVFTSVRRAALTDSEGHFAFDPLPAGDYLLKTETYLADPIEQSRKRYPLPAVLIPRKVALNAGTSPIEFQAVPHVIFEAQYYNGKGEKTTGHEVMLFGKMDSEFWFGQGSSVEGHVLLQVPHGLQDAHVQLSTNEHCSLRYRLKKGEPLKSDLSSIELGTMNDDVEGFEIIRYVAPIVLIKAVDESNQPINSFKVAGAYPWGKQSYILEGETRSDVTFEKQEDGRYRSSQVLPDEEVKFTAMAKGYEDASQKITLPEGERKELTLVLKKEAAAASTAKAVVAKPDGKSK